MTKTFEARKTVRGSYLLSEDRLRRIHKHLCSPNGSVRTTLTFKNERTISSEDLDEILGDSLIGSSEVDELRFKMLNNPNGFCDVVFANRGGAMAYGLQGERSWVLSTEADILNEFNAGKLWYSNLNPNRWPVSNINVAITVTLFFIGLICLGLYLTPLWILTSREFLFVALAFGIVVPGTTLLQYYFFPSLEYDFGKGAVSFKCRRNTMSFLFVTVSLGLCLSVFQTWVASRLGIS